MSRPHIMPLLAPEAPGRSLGQRAARASAVISARLRARAAGQPARAQLICLAVTSALEGGQGSRLADAIVRRVLHCGCPVGTVVLDLGPVTSLEEEACAAILSVHQRLTAIGTRLRLAASGHGLPDFLADAGITQQLGRDAIHPSFRSAVLATYAALPGPGLVLGRIKAALETEAEFITLLPHFAGDAGRAEGEFPPSQRSRGVQGGRPPGLAEPFTRCGWGGPAAPGGGL